MSADLIAYKKSPESAVAYRATLFTITLANGLVITAVDKQRDILFNGLHYSATAYGRWALTGSITRKIGLDTQDTTLTVYHGDTESLPNLDGISIATAIRRGLFESAAVRIEELTMRTYGDVSMGSEIKFAGLVTDITRIGRSESQLKANDWNYALNTEVPNRFFSSSCNWVLFSAGCGLDQKKFETPGGLSYAASTTLGCPQAAAKPDGYFSQGVIVFTSGPNTGLSYSIKSHVGGTLVINGSFFAPPAPGNSVLLYPGCDHTTATCNSKFSNLVNIGSTPFVPVPETAI